MQQPKHLLSRAIIYPKDIQNITGKSERSARRILQRIRKAYGKRRHELVTIEEFCNYTGMREELVQAFIN